VYVVGVHPSAHGQGLGTALTAHGLSYLADAGVEAIDLYVEADNHAALAVYRNLGFIEMNRDVLYQKRAG
ncbi:MAG: GNAT family N-acetyltransferase, partial [Actinomycetales bacterium]|nr:GNAT family N-acetyltransferase [Actinomycetales bacterium]